MAVEASRRSVAEIAREIVQEWRQMPLDVRRCVISAGSVDHVTDWPAYQAVAEMRCKLGAWRAGSARRIKNELETMLAHYRAAQDG